MEQVFEMKVKEKKQKLKDSELELTRRHEERKKASWDGDDCCSILLNFHLTFRLSSFRSASWKSAARLSSRRRATGSSTTTSPWTRCGDEASRPTAKSEYPSACTLTRTFYPQTPTNWLLLQSGTVRCWVELLSMFVLTFDGAKLELKATKKMKKEAWRKMSENI